MSFFAVRFSPYPPEKFSEIVSACCAHRPWFNDHVWHDPEKRRVAVIAYLAGAVSQGRAWEVVRFPEGTVAGVILLNHVNLHIDAQLHAIFFDHELRNKRQLTLAVLSAIFDDPELDLKLIRLEIPTYAKALAGWARKALGFRYDLELSSPDLPLPEASRLSRKYRVTLHDGKWHDAILLSLTRKDLHAWTTSTDWPSVGRSSVGSERSPTTEHENRPASR